MISYIELLIIDSKERILGKKVSIYIDFKFDEVGDISFIFKQLHKYMHSILHQIIAIQHTLYQTLTQKVRYHMKYQDRIKSS